MASGAGLRRSSLPESQTKGEEDGSIGSPPDSRDSTERPPYRASSERNLALHQKQLHGFRSTPVFINLECAILVVLTVVNVFLLVVRFRDPVGILDVNSMRRTEGLKEYEYYNRTLVSTHQSLSPSAHPKLQNASYDGKSILERKSEKNVVRSRNCSAVNEGLHSSMGDVSSQAYHSPNAFHQDFQDMVCQFKIFVYPHNAKDPFAKIFRSSKVAPTGNYASEHYFKMSLLNSNMLTKDPAEADLFYMPFSITTMRSDQRIGVEGIKHFVSNYVSNISVKYPYWDRSGGADHFYVNCHSVGKTATEEALDVRFNAIQVVCSSSYHIKVFYPHKDASIPQVWPRIGFPKQAPLIEQRTTLAFFAGAGNSPVRAQVAKYWSNDSEIKVYTHRIKTPYDEALLTSKYCLHVKGYEVNTARLADAIHFGCVPIIVANYHDLPFNDVLDWRRFSLVVRQEDIPKLKDIIKAVSDEQYVEMQKTVMQVRPHFQWHKKPEQFDAFYMVMYELWLRRHVTRFQLGRQKTTSPANSSHSQLPK